MRIGMLLVIATCAVLTACMTKQGFEKKGFAYGCPIGDTNVGSMNDLIDSKVSIEGKRTTVIVTDLRCATAGDLLEVNATLNNDSSKVKRVSYKFRWMDRKGMRAWDEEPWKPLMLYENSNQVIAEVAPTSKAVDFRLILMGQE